MGEQVDSTLEKCQKEIKALQLANDQLKVDVEILKRLIVTIGGRDYSFTRNELEPKKNPNIGIARVCEMRAQNKPEQKNLKKAYFSSPYSEPPVLVIGLKEIDLEIHEGTRTPIVAYAAKINKDCFEIHLDTWGSGKLHGAACTWLELATNDLEFECGRFGTEDDHPWNKPQNLTSRRITFKNPYSSPPQVVVWLSKIDMSEGKIWSMRTYATDVTMAGFTIHIDSWGDSKIYKGDASWLAYPANKPKVFSGSFNTSELRRSSAPQHHNSGFAKFGEGVFTTPPRVAMAINSFEIDSRYNARLVLDSTHISAEGMTWTLVSRDTTVLFSAGASYIALG